ncbi:family with sequence similarity 135 member A [Phyllostomus discolor]|uniref:Family with sequence similarity 135 member A n=1 Tax=Phyllostomus discolor TaxID=89673 RepID=A0A834ALV2_9CHIR|nr:family with sequence similarity 135 member A [Phyllostomus discolor]
MVLTRIGPSSCSRTRSSSVRQAVEKAEPGERRNNIFLTRISNWKSSICYLIMLTGSFDQQRCCY